MTPAQIEAIALLQRKMNELLAHPAFHDWQKEIIRKIMTNA